MTITPAGWNWPYWTQLQTTMKMIDIELLHQQPKELVSYTTSEAATTTTAMEKISIYLRVTSLR